MMYQHKLVACIKVNGRILREQHGTVLIPFGSEYSILVKNLNSVRAKVKISVDGDDATGGTWLVIDPNNSTELERFIRDGNWTSGNRFKFIERSGDVEAHRGIKADDGIVRLEFATERRVMDVPIVREHYYDEYYPVPQPYYPRPPYWPYPRRPFYGNATRSATGGSRRRDSHSGGMSALGVPTASASGGGSGASNKQSAYTSNFNMFSETSAAVCDSAAGDAGITVAGSVSNQTFHGVPDFPTDQSDVMILTLRGILAGKILDAPMTVQTKLTCNTCGKTAKSDAQFCQTCGTALMVI